MSYTVITTFHPEGLQQYGQRMINTFEANWPKEVDLMVCAENCNPATLRDNTQVYNLLEVSPTLREFVQRHKDNPMAHGLAGPPGVYNPKKAFRWNAVRFAYKVFSVAFCASQIKDGWMIWIDADSHTHSKVPLDWLASVCPSDTMVSYLGRGEKYHSECGWVAYNLDYPQTRHFIDNFVEMYINDEIFNQKEWHDSFIWDLVRRQYQITNKFHNLNTHWLDKGLAGHPFINSELGRYMDHVKGKRKTHGQSRANDIDVNIHKGHPYWENILKGKA
jgi:hypothetical protein